MITQEQLGTLVVRQVIFHDVPNSIRNTTERKPTLSEVETLLEPDRKKLLRDKLVEVIGSSKAWSVTFSPVTSSSVPKEVRSLTADRKGLLDFVGASQRLALELFDKQSGSVSPGLLCLIDVAVDSRPGIAMMKLEREEGAQLKLSGVSGKKTFSMNILNDLVMTEGTRLFKSALFVRMGAGDDEFTSVACDNQGAGHSSDDLAKFWMKFLGCSFSDNPRQITQNFFNSTVSFINQSVTDPVEKSDLYDALHSQLRANRPSFSTKNFLEEHLPESYRRQFRDHLKADNIPIASFKKDLQDIDNKLKRHVYMTRSGAMVSVPESHLEVIEVNDESIIIRDTVSRVK
jgi:hypothetical protein